MNVKLIEATQSVEDGWNHGKFLIGRFQGEWATPSEMLKQSGYGTRSLLDVCGWDARCLLVLDLATGEGAIFVPGGLPVADLEKHRVWVCPMFEPFLEWLYAQDLSDLRALPKLVELPDAPAETTGYRRSGP